MTAAEAWAALENGTASPDLVELATGKRPSLPVESYSDAFKGLTDPGTTGDAFEEPPTPSIGSTEEKTESVGLVGESLPSIMARNFPPLRWVIHEAVPVGLSMLSGPAKVGKSFMALDMALSVALGVPWMGRKTTQGRVLYLALEDGGRRIQDRAKMMLAGRTPPDSLIFVHQGMSEWLDRYGGDLAGNVGRFIEDCLEFDFVIVDTLSRAFPSADQDKQREMQAVLAPLQASGRAVLLIDHTKKGGGAVHRDELNNVQWIEQAAGSRAKGATVDAALGMVKVTGLPEEDSPEDVFVLGASLRDADSWQMTVTRNRETMRFERSELPPKSDGNRRGHTAEMDAWMRDRLAFGESLKDDVEADGDKAGYSPKQLERARERVGVTCRQDGFGTGKRSFWSLPTGQPSTRTGHSPQSPPFVPFSPATSQQENGGKIGKIGKIEQIPMPLHPEGTP